MAVSTLVVQVRSTGTAALTRTGAAFNALGSNVARATRAMTAQTRQVSSVAGAYRATNGLWYHANGLLVLQRNHVRNVTTAFGRLVNVVGAVGRTLGRGGRGIANLTQAMAQRMAGLAVMVQQLGRFAPALIPILGIMVNLSAVAVSLAGAIQLIAPAAVAGGLAMATLKMGMSGVGDALKAGLSGDTEEFAKALKKLSPNAAEFVKHIVIIRDQYKALQKVVQNELFRGLGPALGRLQQVIYPLAAKWLPKTADLFSRVGRAVIEVFTASGKSGQLEAILRNVYLFLSGILGVAKPLAEVFLNIAEVAAPQLARIGEGAESAAQKFSEWIKKLKDNGTLRDWLQSAMDNLKTLGLIAGDIGRLFGAMWSAGDDSGKTTLQNIRDVTKAMADWANSKDGQKIISLFGDIGAAITAVAPIFAFFAENARIATLTVTSYFTTMVGGLLRLSAMALRALGMDGLASKLDSAADKLFEFRDRANQALAGVSDKTVTLTLRYRQIGNSGIGLRSAEQGATYSSGAGGRASGGPVAAGRTYRVGERGPEMVTFGSSGYVHPAGSRAAGSMTAQLVVEGGPNRDWFAMALDDAVRNNRVRLRLRPGTNQVTV